MIDDEKIIEMFFERSEQAVRELDNKYGKICHHLSFNILNNRQDAEECVNDAYMGAWNAIPPARPHPLFPYIVKIVRNISLKLYWRKEAAKRSGHYTVALEEIESCISDRKTVEDEIEARELARTFYALTSETLENTGFFSIFFVCNLICNLKLQPNSFSQIVFWFRIHRGLILMMETLFELFPSTLQVYCIPNACKCRG